MSKADTALSDIQGFVKDNKQPLTSTISNAEAFSEALKNNADGIDDFLKSVGELSTTVTSLSKRLDARSPRSTAGQGG